MEGVTSFAERSRRVSRVSGSSPLAIPGHAQCQPKVRQLIATGTDPHTSLLLHSPTTSPVHKHLSYAGLGLKFSIYSPEKDCSEVLIDFTRIVLSMYWAHNLAKQDSFQNRSILIELLSGTHLTDGEGVPHNQQPTRITGVIL